LFGGISRKTKNTTSHMKKLLSLSMIISLAMVCSCQKQDAAAEQQLAQRKAELDTREKALEDREKAVAEREKAVARAAMLSSDLKSRALKKDASSNVQPSASIPPGLEPPTDTAQLKANRERRIEQLRALRQRRLEAIQKMRSMGAQTNTGAEAPADSGASGSTSGSTDTSASAGASGEPTSASPSPTP
jgi:hypothetical protein